MDLKRWGKGEKLEAARLNEIVDAANAHLPVVGFGGVEAASFGTGTAVTLTADAVQPYTPRVGTIVAAGPDGETEADLPAYGYWVQLLKNEVSAANAEPHKALSLAGDAVHGVATAGGPTGIVPAMHVQELSQPTPRLPVGTPVTVLPIRFDAPTDGSVPRVRWVLSVDKPITTGTVPAAGTAIAHTTAVTNPTLGVFFSAADFTVTALADDCPENDVYAKVAFVGYDGDAWISVDNPDRAITHIGPSAVTGSVAGCTVSVAGNTLTVTPKVVTYDARGHVVGESTGTPVSFTPTGSGNGTYTADETWIHVENNVISHIGPAATDATKDVEFAFLTAGSGVNAATTGVVLKNQSMALTFDARGHGTGEDVGTPTDLLHVPQVLNDLADVDLAGAADGDVLVRDAGVWKKATPVTRTVMKSITSAVVNADCTITITWDTETVKVLP